MVSKTKRFPIRTVSLALGLALAGTAIGAVQAGSTNEPVRCEIKANADNGMITLQGTVHANQPLSGTYSFRVASAGHSGGTNIRQGGGFTAGPDAPAMLGRVMLGNAGAIYDADLEITAHGATVKCSERVGGAI